MKRTMTLLGAAVLTLLLLVGCNQEQKQPTITIGVVDEAAAFQNNEAAAKAMAYLQEMGAPLQKKAEAAYKTMQEDQTEENVAAYKAAMAELQQVMNGEQQRVVALIDGKYREVLDNYREEKGLTMILSKESVVSSADTVDVTDDIVAAMNALELDLTAPAAAEQPADESAE